MSIFKNEIIQNSLNDGRRDSQIIEILPQDYDPTFFIARTEKEVLNDLIKNSNKPNQPRAAFVTGPRGIGISWFGQNVCPERLSPDNQVGEGKRPEKAFAIYVDFKEWSPQPSTDASEMIARDELAIKLIIANLMQRIALSRGTYATGIRNASQAEIEKKSLSDLKRWFIKDLSSLMNQADSPPVIFFDNVSEARWLLLDLLDEYLLSPLTALGVFTIVAGHGQNYPWQSEHMQLECQEVRLAPFNQQQTLRQLGNFPTLQVNDTDTVHALSQGIPELTMEIAQHGPKVGLSVELARILSDVLASTNPETSELLLDYLEAICLLRRFDDDCAVVMMKAMGKNISRKVAMENRKTLMRFSLAWLPEKNARGWILDETLHHCLEQLLHTLSPDRFRILQQSAKELYDEWVAQYPQVANYWQPEADYHQEQLDLLAGS